MGDPVTVLHVARTLGLPCRGRVRSVRRVPIVPEPRTADDYRSEEYVLVVTYTTDADVAAQVGAAGAMVVAAAPQRDGTPQFDVSFAEDAVAGAAA